MNIDPFILNTIQWILGFVATVLLGIGAWWCRSLAGDIKELQQSEQETRLMIASITAKTPEREKLQDERWAGLQKDMEHQHKNLDRMQRDLQALVHRNLKITE